MNALILASYILRASEGPDRHARFAETEAEWQAGARRTLASLAVSAIGFGIFIAVIGAL